MPFFGGALIAGIGSLFSGGAATGGLVAGLGSVAGSLIGGDAATSAAQTQANAANQAAQIQQNEFNSVQQLEQPYVQSGNSALSLLNYGLGTGPAPNGGGAAPDFAAYVQNNPDLLAGFQKDQADNNPNSWGNTEAAWGQKQWDLYGQNENRGFTPTTGQAAPSSTAAGGITSGSLIAPFNPANLSQTPGYQFQLQQGEQAVTDQATATGGVGGGNTLKALMNYGQELASTTYQQQFNDYLAQQQQQLGALQTAAGSGQNAAAGLASAGQTSANNVGNLLTSGAAATAGGQVGAANAITGGINNLSSNYLLSQLLNNGGGSAAGGASGLALDSSLASLFGS
jgi:hypothetical protein